MTAFEGFGLKGRKALVTGGARGIGKSVASALARAGADVAIADLNGAEAEKAARELGAHGVKALGVAVDVTRPDEVKRMVEAVLSAFGTIDVLFNNAGICVNEKAEEMSFASWQKVIDVNLTGVFLVAQAVGRVMIARGRGSIINTASMSGHIVNQPQPQSGYNASKAGVIMLTKSLAAEWAMHHVRVNSISPGYIATEMTKKADASWVAAWTAATPMRRMGNPEELQGAVLWLASDMAAFTTGSDVVIDGGFTCV
jgi:NAD(P)-dependent dehydrogenase (short-subunit alcohol dehydrogenase family)